jgi:hypothetical protein
MFAIAQSEIVEDAAQADGRRYIRERHTDSGGELHEFVYLADANQDASVVLANRAAGLADQILRTYEDKEAGNGVFAG